MAKVRRMVWLTLMPMRVEALLSSDTQRMAQPMRAFWVNRYSATMMTAETTMVMMVA